MVLPEPAEPADAAVPAAAAPGYTLPVWVAAAARAAVAALRGEPFTPTQELDLLAPSGRRGLPVRAAALLAPDQALGEAICDPGDRLDLTRGLVVWVLAGWLPLGERPAAQAAEPEPPLVIEAGEGVGRHAASDAPCLSDYARRLLEANLLPLLPPDRRLRLRVVLPAGRELALRTSNAAFGVVDGLALIGTRAEVQAGAAPDQLAAALAALEARSAAPGFRGDLVLVIGENGLDLAPRCGLPAELLLKAGNWLGPLLVAAGQRGVRRLLLFGVQGKLVKLAGGIFHTHHHLADGRAEVLTALAALEGVAGGALAALHAAPTVDAALEALEADDPALAERLRRRLAAAIEARCRDYLARHGQQGPGEVGAVLFDRRRRVRVAGPVGSGLLEAFRGAP